MKTEDRIARMNSDPGRVDGRISGGFGKPSADEETGAVGGNGGGDGTGRAANGAYREPEGENKENPGRLQPSQGGEVGAGGDAVGTINVNPNEELDVLVGILNRLDKQTKDVMPHYETWCEHVRTFRMFVDIRMRRLPLETEDDQIAYTDCLAYIRSSIATIYEAWIYGQPMLRDLNRYHLEIEKRLNGTFSTQWNTMLKLIGLDLETLYQEQV